MAPIHMPAALDAHLAPIRAFTSLTRRDADAVRETVRAAGGMHTVAEHDDYDGYLSLLLTPTEMGTESGPAYLVCGRTRAVELAEIDGDDYGPIGRFPSIGAAMIVLRERLERTLWRRT